MTRFTLCYQVPRPLHPVRGAFRHHQEFVPLLPHIPNTTTLGQAHSHRKLLPSVWGGDGPFRQKLPHKIPVLKAHRTPQMDKVGGYFLNPGLFRTHGNLRKMTMDDQNRKCIPLVQGIYGRM